MLLERVGVNTETIMYVDLKCNKLPVLSTGDDFHDYRSRYSHELRTLPFRTDDRDDQQH